MTRLALRPDGGVRHAIGLDEISNDLAGWIADDLVAPGLLDPAAFESTFVSVVCSTAPEPAAAWTAFYRNTLRELAAGGAAGGTNAGMAPVHERAAALAVGDVVELGCCFGFLSLRLAAAGHRVTAVDLSPGTVRLLASVAPALRTSPGAGLRVLAGDALAVPLADRCADTVFAVHLLEHLPPPAGAAVLAEMLRLARRRVVVAVPYEDEPNPTWGHIRTFDATALTALGATTGHPFEVIDHHGGWLVVDVGQRGWPPTFTRSVTTTSHDPSSTDWAAAHTARSTSTGVQVRSWETGRVSTSTSVRHATSRDRRARAVAQATGSPEAFQAV